MSKDRAQYILANVGLASAVRMAFRKSCDMPTSRIYPDGITQDEDDDVKRVWNTMPGWTCYMDALRRIAA